MYHHLDRSFLTTPHTIFSIPFLSSTVNTDKMTALGEQVGLFGSRLVKVTIDDCLNYRISIRNFLIIRMIKKPIHLKITRTKS